MIYKVLRIVLFIQLFISFTIAQNIDSDDSFCEILECIFTEDIFYEIKNKRFFGTDTITLSIGSDFSPQCGNTLWVKSIGKNIVFNKLKDKTSELNLHLEYIYATKTRNLHWIIKELDFKGNLTLITLFRPINNLEIFIAYKKIGENYQLVDSTYGFY